jgi:hypothetical protein
MGAQASGSVYQDEHGRYADFHSLRYTFATFMHRNWMRANFVRKQMRHKILRQTDGYTDEMQLPIWADGLPEDFCSAKRPGIFLMTECEHGHWGANKAMGNVSCCVPNPPGK